MNIAVDCELLLRDDVKNRGIGRYSEIIINGIKKRISNNDNLYLIVNKYENIKLVEKIFPDSNVCLVNIIENSNKVKMLHKYAVSSYESFFILNKIDIYISLYHLSIPLNFMKKIKKHYNINFLVVVHDLIQYVFPEIYMQNNELKEFYNSKLEILKYADRIISISESTKRDIVRFTDVNPDKIDVVYEAAFTSTYSDIIKDNLLKEQYGIEKKYIMYTGGDDYRKNIIKLIHAFAKCSYDIINNYQLVVVCRLADKNKYESQINALNMSGKIVLTGYVEDDILDLLYKNAELFIFPSLYEGFGLPVIEAMSYGLPVIVGNNSSMPEIVGDKGVYFNAESVKDIAKTITEVLENSEVLMELKKVSIEQSKLFSWEKCCNETYSIIKNLCNNNDMNREYKRLKIAYLSPLNPDKSGISDYSEELLPILKDKIDIDIYTSTKKITNLDIKRNFKIFTYNEFENNVGKYDIILYQIGNNILHWEIMQFARKYPGIVVMHDYNLRVFFDYIANWSKSVIVADDFIKSNFILQYGSAEGIQLYEKNKDNLTYNDKIEFNRYIVSNAVGVIVHNNYSKKRLLDHSPMLPVYCIPMAVAVNNSFKDINALKKKYNIKNSDFVIGTFGNIIPEKRPKEMIEGIFKYIKEMKVDNIKIIISGNVWDGLENVICELENQYEIKNSIIITNHVPMDEFTSIMKMCDVVFNLRYPTNGETSGTITRLFEIGKPVITSNIGSFGEYPDDICIKINSGTENEINEIFNAVKLLYENKDIRDELSKKSYEYIKNNNSLQKMADMYIDVINLLYDIKNSFYKPIYEDEINTIINEYIGITKKIPDETISEYLFRYSCGKNNKINSSPKEILNDVNESIRKMI